MDSYAVLGFRCCCFLSFTRPSEELASFWSGAPEGEKRSESKPRPCAASASIGNDRGRRRARSTPIRFIRRVPNQR